MVIYVFKEIISKDITKALVILSFNLAHNLIHVLVSFFSSCCCSFVLLSQVLETKGFRKRTHPVGADKLCTNLLHLK